MNRVKSFFNGVTKELKKITWPTEKEMKSHTFEVLVFVGLLSVFFFVVDTIIGQVMNFLG